MNLIKKFLLITIGYVSIGLGILGIFLPLLPTTPFVLLAGYCFLKSSNRLYMWIITHKIFGKYIYNYMHHRTITLKTKITSILLLWISIITSLFFVKNLLVKILLIFVAIGVTIHLFLLKTFDLKKK